MGFSDVTTKRIVVTNDRCSEGKKTTFESRMLVSARRLRDLKAAPEDMEIEAIEPVEPPKAGLPSKEKA